MPNNNQNTRLSFHWLRTALRQSTVTALAAVSIFLGLSSFAAPANIAQGVAWLQSQISSAGALVSESRVASTPQAQCETANTLIQLVGASSQVSGLIASLESTAAADQATESLACAQYLRQKLGQLTAPSALDGRRVANGAYAAYTGMAVDNALDTGWALQAQLKNLSAANKTQVLAWLQAHQAADGSFAVSARASLLSTAVVLRGITQEASQNPVAADIATRAASYLIAQKLASGSWGDDVALTAVVFEAVHPYAGKNPQIAASVASYLLGAQSTDGSWQTDTYVTALALRALSLTDTVPTNPLEAFTTATVRGQVTASANGHNTAQYDH